MQTAHIWQDKQIHTSPFYQVQGQGDLMPTECNHLTYVHMYTPVSLVQNDEVLTFCFPATIWGSVKVMKHIGLYKASPRNETVRSC